MKALKLYALASCLLGSTAMARGLAPPDLKIRSLTYAGTGCPAGSVAQNIASDREAFTLLFDSFQASSGAGSSILDKRKFCQLLVDFDYPPGWQFSLVDLTARGYASLDPGVSALQETTFYWQGSTLTGDLPYVMQGPYDDDYEADNQIPVAKMDWSDCHTHRALNVKTQVRLSGFGNGLITEDSLDGGIEQIYGIAWQQCQ